MFDSLIRRIRVTSAYLFRHFRISIRVAVIAFFLFATVLTASVAISLQYYFSTTLATESTLSTYQKTAADTRNYFDQMDERASATVRILSQFTNVTKSQQVSEETQRLFVEGMRRNPLMFGLYIGFANGDFYQLLNLNADHDIRKQLHADAEDRWAIITITGKEEKRQQTVKFYDDAFQLRTTKQQKSSYDPRRRGWYTNAKRGEIHKTAPYLFQQLQKPGETYSIKLPNHDAVLALDITLSSLSDYLSKQVLGDASQIFIYQETGELIATNQPLEHQRRLPAAPSLTLTAEQQALVKNTPFLLVSNEMDWPPINFAASGQPYGYAIDVLNYISAMTGIELRYVNGLHWNELAEMFVQDELDVLQPVFYDPSRQWLGSLTDAFLTVPYGVITARNTPQIHHIEELKGKTVAIPEGWLLATHLEEQFPQIKIIRVPNVRAMFDVVRQGKADAAIDTAPILNYTAKQFFIDDVVVSQPIDFGEVTLPNQLHFMLNKANSGLTELFNQALAQLGPDYQDALKEKWFSTKHHIDYQLGTVPFAELMRMAQQQLPEGLETIEVNGEEQFVFATSIGEHNDKADYFAIVTPVDAVLGPAIDKVKAAILITAAALLFLLPLSWFLASPFVTPIRRLAMDSEKITQRKYADVEKVASRITEVGDLASSMNNMSEAIQQHEKAQQELLDAFIKVIAQAIDDKSPHTAGHCERVPELAFMLVREAEKAQHGMFSGFVFNSPEEWREFEVAAWLHDCGKITTPERIIDKGTKLETIYNRIHEVRMRFEVLWRDAEIEFLLNMAEPGADEAMLLTAKQQKQQQLQDDFAFIANANVGSEFMSDEYVERIKTLANVTWQRYFDDRLGLSHIELMRYPSSTTALPATEQLLADKPEHIIERVHSTDYDPSFGIKMDIPQHLYNVGELYNLSIRAGTLTAEDRFKINEHIISTIKMLESLPFPDELKNVPRYASTHHETTKGTGYPRQLSGDELSIPERVMVLADIYEALTAADRPYKKAKPISEALDILHKMVLNEHVDVEVFELFLKSGVYLRYAKRFLPEAQIDEVDITKYLRSA